MRLNKRVMAAVMVGVLTLSSSFAVSAASSPVVGGTTVDPNHVDHLEGKTITSDVNVSARTAIVKKAESSKSAEVKSAVVFNVARTDSGSKVPITQIGTGKAGVFNSKAGRIITRVTVKSSANVVTIKANAFKGSKVKTLKLNSKKTIINKNAFNKTKAKSPKIYVNGKVSAKKGAFKGLSKKAKIIVSKKAYSKKAFKKLKKALKKAGFKGTISRK